jgi:hypothetical protein
VASLGISFLTSVDEDGGLYAELRTLTNFLNSDESMTLGGIPAQVMNSMSA